VGGVHICSFPHDCAALFGLPYREHENGTCLKKRSLADVYLSVCSSYQESGSESEVGCGCNGDSHVKYEIYGNARPRERTCAGGYFGPNFGPKATIYGVTKICDGNLQ
jgi:hypothetical protein